MKTTTVAVALGTVVLAACGGSDNKSSDAGAPAAKTTAAVDTSGSGYGGASNTSAKSKSTASGAKVTEALYDNYFGTKTISGKPGARVKVTLTNKGSNEHNFKIDSQKGVDADLSPGQTKTVTVTIPKTGSVQFYCEYHKGIGMVGSVKAS